MDTLRKGWALLKTLFWFDRLDRLAQEKRSLVFKILPWFARLFLLGYLVVMVSWSAQLVMSPSVDNLIMWLLSFFLFPLGYRLAIGLQVWFHSIVSG